MRRRLLLIAAVAVTAVTAVTAVAGCGRSPGRSPAPGSASASASRSASSVPRPGPVLVVPGYGGAMSGLAPLVTAVRATGRDVTVVALPGDGRGDLDRQATVLAADVRAALARTGARSVDVVGYSAGGVVARLWARDHGGAALARRVVTIGSPHHGTNLALLGSLVPDACPTACRQLVPGSALLTALNTGDETPDGPVWVSVWSTTDDVVVPVDSARLAGALDETVQSLCPSDAVRHAGLPADPVVRRMVLAALATPIRHPAPGC